MDFAKALKVAMIDKNIKGAKSLSNKSGMTYNKVIRALNGDTSSRMIDVIDLGKFLGIEMSFNYIIKGDK